MANPKRRHSKTRTRKRRTHVKTKQPKVIACPNCGAASLPHHICSECGFYRGKQAIEKDVIT